MLLLYYNNAFLSTVCRRFVQEEDSRQDRDHLQDLQPQEVHPPALHWHQEG